MSKKKSIFNVFTRQDIVILISILIVAFSFRIYKIYTPLADWHSWRQVDTAAVARNFVEDGFDLLHPRYDDLSNGQTGEYNPEGLRFVEFPIYNATFASTYKLFPYIPLEQHGRMLTIVMSMITIAIVYYLLRVEVSQIAGTFGAGIFATFPFFVYYSRVVLPDTSAVSCVFIAILFLYQWAHSDSEKKSKHIYYAISLIFAGLAVLIKPVAIFYYLPLAYLFFRKHMFKIFLRPEVYAYFLLAIAPFVGWRYWISLFPVGGPGFEWLITSVNTFEGQKVIFMRPAFFRWVFYERILLLIMGGWAGAFLVVGTVRKLVRPWLMYTIGASALAYLMVFQGGNVQHDYYQTIIFPALAIFAGMGIDFLLSTNTQTIPKIFVTGIIIAVLGFSSAMSFEQVKGMYNVHESLLSTARVINTITPKDAKIVTDTFGDTTLLYNSHRQGIPAISDSLPNLKERGMDYFVTSSQSEITNTQENYPEMEIIFENDDVTIFKL